MKMSVRLLSLALAALMAFAFTACKGEGDASYDGSIDPNIFLDADTAESDADGDEIDPNIFLGADTVTYESKYVQKEFQISTFQGLGGETVTKDTLQYFTAAAKAHKEAGFTLIENAWISSREMMGLAAKACETAKIKFLAQDLTAGSGFSAFQGQIVPTVTEENVTSAVDELKDYKYLEGYYTWDEVTLDTLALCSQLNNLFQKHDPKRLAFAIALPSYGPYRWDNQDDPDNSTFARYVREFEETVDPPVVCFDYYPFQQHGGENTDLTTCDLWRDMGLFRRLALEKEKPFWFYFQGYNMGTHTPGHTYTFTNEMRSVQMYYAIAYGAKSLSYFITAGGILVDNYGNKSAEFNNIKELNHRVKNLGDFLFEKQSEELLHFGLGEEWTEPYYLDSVADSRLVKDAPDGTIVATFGDKSSKKYVLVVNKDYRNAVTGQLKLKKALKVSRYDHLTDKTGKAVKSAAVELNIPAGECALYIVE